MILASFVNSQAAQSPPVVSPVKTRSHPNIYSQSNYGTYRNDMLESEVSFQTIDGILEREKQNNKADAWNKLDKSIKTQRLHIFAERYGIDHNFASRDIKSLKVFFTSCLEKGKLCKTKELTYNKETQEIIGISALCFNSATRAFTLKIIDTKRVSTMKSLTPKRNSIKHLPEAECKSESESV
jgi:hypothetical protein